MSLQFIKKDKHDVIHELFVTTKTVDRVLIRIRVFFFFYQEYIFSKSKQSIWPCYKKPHEPLYGSRKCHSLPNFVSCASYIEICFQILYQLEHQSLFPKYSLQTLLPEQFCYQWKWDVLIPTGCWEQVFTISRVK